MTQTLISTESLLAAYEQKLLNLNVRWIEQFICYVEAAGVGIVAEYLKIKEAELEKVIQDVKDKHPEMILPEGNNEEYHLGYRIGRKHMRVLKIVLGVVLVAIGCHHLGTVEISTSNQGAIAALVLSATTFAGVLSFVEGTHFE